MKSKLYLITGAAWLALAAFPIAGRAEDRDTLQVEKGAAAFDVGTNISAISIHGTSSALEGKASVRQQADQLVLESVEARLPVKSLNTGMGLRDEHMRKYVFTTPDGKTPDLVFTAANVNCPAAPAECRVNGSLSVRGVERPFAMALKIHKDGAGAFRAAGEGTVKLSVYGIERPSQFGVKTNDDVKLKIELAGRKAASQVASAEGR